MFAMNLSILESSFLFSFSPFIGLDGLNETNSHPNEPSAISRLSNNFGGKITCGLVKDLPVGKIN